MMSKMNGSACLASYFGIEVDGKRIVHQYDVNIVYHQEDRGPIGMTGPLEGQPDSGPKGVDDLTRWKNRGIIEKVMGAKVCIYDSARQLFTPTKMKEIKGFRLEKDELPSDMAATFYGKGYIEVSITKNLEKPSFDIADWSEYDRNDLWRNEDRTWRNFCEVLTTDPAVRRGFIPMKGQIFGPPKDFAAGLVVRHGAKKSCQFIQDGQRMKPVLSFDSVKKVFYPGNANFLQVVQRFCNYDPDFKLGVAEKLFKRIKVRSTLNPARVMTFNKFGKPAVKCTATHEGKIVSLPEFYKAAKGIKLKAPNFEVALMAGAKGDFPLEFLEIVPNQAVPVNRLPPKLEIQQKRLNIVNASLRFQAIMEMVNSLQLNNETTRAFGVRIHTEMTAVNFQKLPFPQSVMTFRSRLTFIDADANGGMRLRNEKFLAPANIPIWAVIYANDDRYSNLFSAFVGKIKDAGAKRGLNLGRVVEVPVPSTDMGCYEWRKLFNDIKSKHGVGFFMIVDQSRDNHYEIKAAEVLVPGIVTQQVSLFTATDVVYKNKWMTADNIVLKINLKAGGLNCGVRFNEAARELRLDEPVLVIGLDVNHPTGENHIGPQTQPSVVGYSANYGKQPCAFMGDYFFQNSRTETIDAALLQATVEKIVRNFIANRGQPKRVVVLRDGVSEGQYTDIVDQELQAVRNGVARLCKQRVEFNLVVLTKTHVVRHFAKTPQINSLAPGTFINDGARKDLTQFYFAAHRAIQGTSQDLLATVLVNETQSSKIAVQHFLHGLCHLHGLSGTPVSLPEPVYQADILAQRGAEVFKVLNNGDIDPTNFADLTARFSYGKQQLPSQRFAA